MPSVADFQTNFKQPRGTALLEARDRRAKRVAAEQKEMQAALKRDERRCRFPHCEFKGKKLPIDPCHAFGHRGSGGNPDGTRTAKALIVSLCRAHHGLLDQHQIAIEPLSAAMADGLLAFFAKHPETGRMEHVATEVRRGVPETRGL